jgi:hypothetical protein
VRTHKVANVGGLTYGNEVGQYISSVGGNAGMVIDQILSDDTVRIVFDTYRTTTDLEVNEVRVRIYLARGQTSDPALLIRRTVECILTMRGKSSPVDRANDLSMLHDRTNDLTSGQIPLVFDY